MAARLNKRHQDSVRAKIQASALIRVLQQEALGKSSLADGQRESAKFLLNKSLSNPPEDKNLNVDMNGRIEVEFL